MRKKILHSSSFTNRFCGWNENYCEIMWLGEKQILINITFATNNLVIPQSQTKWDFVHAQVLLLWLVANGGYTADYWSWWEDKQTSARLNEMKNENDFFPHNHVPAEKLIRTLVSFHLSLSPFLISFSFLLSLSILLSLCHPHSVFLSLYICPSVSPFLSFSLNLYSSFSCISLPPLFPSIPLSFPLSVSLSL